MTSRTKFSAHDPTDELVSGLCWLAFLITEDWGLSLDIVCSALDPEDVYDCLSGQWMIVRSRRRVASAAIARIRAELPESARRTEQAVATDWSTHSSQFLRARPQGVPVTKAALRRALLAIDKFPRCTLLLVVFEGLTIVEAAVLLEENEALVRGALGLALLHLTQNLTGQQGWNGLWAGSRN